MTLSTSIKGLYARQFLFLGKKGNPKNILKDNYDRIPNVDMKKKKKKKPSSLQNKNRRITNEKHKDNILSSKYINLNSQLKPKFIVKKKRPDIFYETENSFLARIWPDKNQLKKKESIYETMAKHNRRHQKGNFKEISKMQKINRSKKGI